MEEHHLRRTWLIRSIAGLLPVMFFLLCLTGCGGDSGYGNSSPTPPTSPSGPTVPIFPGDGLPVTGSAPPGIQVEGFDRRLLINFTAVADAWNTAAIYDLRYATVNNINIATSLGTNVLQRNQGSSGPSGPVKGEITGLTNDVQYFIWINAIWEGHGKTEYGMATGTPVPFPSVPSSVTATGGEESIDVTWDSVRYASSYEVSYHTLDNLSGVPEGNKKTTADPGYTITDLTNGTPYYVWVRARNNNGDSPPSDVEQATPAAASEPPGPVGPLTVAHGAKRITASWDRVPGASYYELRWSNSSLFSSLDAGTCESDPQCKVVRSVGGTASAAITGLTNNTEYSLWVIAVNSAGASAGSPIARVTPKPKSEELPIDFSNINFQLGTATAEYIFGEYRPRTPFPRDGYQDNIHRGKETPIGDLFTDSAMWYLNERLDSGKNVDFVFLNSAFIDGAMSSPGVITVRTLLSATGSARDEIVILEMKGSDIKSLFDFAAANAPHVGFRGRYEGISSGQWPIVSKEVNYTLSYKYVDRDFMKKEFNSITPAEAEPYYIGKIKTGTLKLKGAGFDNNKIYHIATTDYNSEGFYVAPMFKALNQEYTGITYWHAVAEYIYDHGSVTPAAVDGRIQIEGGAPGGPLGVYEGYNRYCPAGSTYDEDSGCIF